MPRPSLKGIGNPEDDFDGLPPSDGRTYTFDLKLDHGGGDFIKDYSRADFTSDPDDENFQLMERAFAAYRVPKISTALGQAKRAMVASLAVAVTRSGQWLGQRLRLLRSLLRGLV